MHISSIDYDDKVGMLCMRTNTGLNGLCPGVDRKTVETVTELFGDILIGQDPYVRERMWQAMVARALQRGVQTPIWAYADVALWDLLGKVMELPVFRVIGGFRDRVSAAQRGGRHDNIGDVISEAIRAQAAGFAAYVDRYIGHELREMTGSLRDAVGTDFILAHDGQHRYDQYSAIQIGRVLQDAAYYWFESPLKSSDLMGLKKVASALDVPIVETVYGISALQYASQLAATQAADMLRVRVPDSGGITDVIKIARLAESFGMHCEIEVNPSMGGFVEAQLLGAIKNAYFFYFDDGVTTSQKNASRPHNVDGYVRVPASPGIGIGD